MKNVLTWGLACVCGICLVQDAAAGRPFFRAAGWPSWSAMVPEQVMPDTQAALAETRRQLEAICALQPEEYTFENTFVAYVRVGEQLQQVQTLVGHLMMTRPTAELQKAQQMMMEAVVRFSAERIGERRVEDVLMEAAKAPWVAQLAPEKQRYVQQVLEKLRNSGAGLSAEQQGRKTCIEKELHQLRQQFSANLERALTSWKLVITDPQELAGMPAEWMEQSAAAARALGIGTEDAPAWLVDLMMCPAMDVMTYCHVEETRRRCWEGVSSPGTARAVDNEPLLRRAMELRQEQAELLGYRHFADMQAARSMMGTAEKALAFVDQLMAAYKPAFDAEVAEYLAALSRVKGERITRIEPWNELYYAKDIPAYGEDFQIEQLSPYFQGERVIGGMLRLWEKLLGIRITEQKVHCPARGESSPAGVVEVWHPLVRAFTVHDTASGRHIGSFYMDLYPRPGKQGEAWCMPLQLAILRADDSPREANLAALMANITPPGQQGHLLHHGDLYALFHEFGHLMHMLLAQPPLPGQHAMSVEQDFLEMPSQLQELWIWEPEALATFARHFRTDEPLPAELAAKLVSSRRKKSLLPTMQMLHTAKLDLEMNMHYADKFKDSPLDEAAAELLAPWRLPYTCTLPCELRTTTHTMTPGYAGCFYTYLWSELLARDAFSRFRKEGILNPATGADYRKHILEPGGSKPARQLFRDFMGRDPDPATMQQGLPGQ